MAANEKMRVYLGWDVGGWNCDRNKASRDALVFLDSGLAVMGSPWRGSLRKTINSSETTSEFIENLAQLCDAGGMPLGVTVTLAIDAPLGFPESLRHLLDGKPASSPLAESRNNPYLFRYTERYLAERGIQPLSAVKDMIGSQATKAIHVVAKFAPEQVSCGVWHDSGGFGLTVIEAYPAACRESRRVDALRQKVHGGAMNHVDERDALTCALVAYMHANETGLLDAPPDGGDSVPKGEGWIWVPKDALGRGT